MKLVLCPLVLLWITTAEYGYSQGVNHRNSLEINGNVKTKTGIGTLWFKKQLLPGKTEVKLDSFVVKEDGNFLIRIPEIDPGYYWLEYRDEKIRSAILLMIDSGEYKFDVHIDTTSFNTEQGRILTSRMEMEGSNDRNLLDGYFDIRRHYYNDLIFPLEKRLRELNSKVQNPGILDSLNTCLKAYRKEMIAKLNRYVLSEMGTSIAIFQTMNVWDNTEMAFMEEVIEKFMKERIGSFILPHMEERYEQLVKTSLLNQKAPLFVLSDSANNVVAFEKFLGKGDIILDFWASWCGPCIKEMQATRELYKEILNKNVIIIGVSTDKISDNWVKALRKHELQWVNVIDTNGEIAKKYGISELPTNYLIDKNGTVKMKNVTIRDVLSN